jgi:hypothetical protein
LEDDASDQVWVHLPLRLHLAAGGGFDPSEDASELLVAQLGGGRQLDVEDPLLGGNQSVELVDDVCELRCAALLGDQAQEVDHELVGALGDARQHVRLHGRLDLRVLEQAGEIGRLGKRGAQLLKLRMQLVELALLLPGLEERLRVDAVSECYDRLPSSSEKSISASASSISRCWSLPVSDLRVIFSAASRLSLPTSSRICPRAWCVAWSIWRRVSSRRRWRSSSVSWRTRSRWASPTRRASLRISSASDFA